MGSRTGHAPFPALENRVQQHAAGSAIGRATKAVPTTDARNEPVALCLSVHNNVDEVQDRVQRCGVGRFVAHAWYIKQPGLETELGKPTIVNVEDVAVTRSGDQRESDSPRSVDFIKSSIKKP